MSPPSPLLKIVPGYLLMPKYTNSAQEQGRPNITSIHPTRFPFPAEQIYNLCPTRSQPNVIRIISNTLPSHRVGRLNPRFQHCLPKKLANQTTKRNQRATRTKRVGAGARVRIRTISQSRGAARSSSWPLSSPMSRSALRRASTTTRPEGMRRALLKPRALLPHGFSLQTAE
jgi:hypothetical protein